MAETLDLSMFVERGAAGTSHMMLAVEGVACAGCIRKIENGLTKLPGIIDARLNFTQRRLAVDWRDDEIDAAGIVKAIEGIGYHAHPFAPERFEADDSAQAKWLMKCLAVAGFAAMNVMLLSISVWAGNVSDMTQETRDLFHWLSALIALPAAAYAGQPFFRSALRALRARQLNMDVPISLGVVLALALSVFETATHAAHAYFDSAIMLLFFLLCGRYLDLAMRRKTRVFAGNLASLKAEFAHRLDASGELTQVPVAALHPGDRVLVRPGERMPGDGIVLSGTSEIDESLVTGETLPRAVGAGTTVYAGSVNLSGALTMRVTAAGTGTLVDEVERLLDKAIAAKSQTVRLADRAARFYAPVVHATAALTAIGWLIAGASFHDSIVVAIAVLIITCPCALALAIPAVQVVAAGSLFRAGLILNGGDAIERLADVDTVVFDKTGTLTLPDPSVDETVDIDPDILERAARLALSSRHPLAAALARRARERIAYPGAVEQPGQGVRALIDGEEARLGSAKFCGLAEKEQPAAARDADASFITFAQAGKTATIAIRQALRPDAVAVTKALRARNLRLVVLSGDRSAAVAPVANELGISDWRAGLKPAEKIAVIEHLQSQGRRVLMVGDGLNDAPALAAAHVSLSPVTAAHLTQAHADALFLGDHLKPVLRAVVVARRARSLMKQNLALAVVYNALAVPIAIAGFVTPLIAAVAMSGSSMLVTLNALRARLAADDDLSPVAGTGLPSPDSIRTSKSDEEEAFLSSVPIRQHAANAARRPLVEDFSA
ncbi:MAG TPA: heavy metal translocating P-type ATPase [Xanthobacteraceae bacterium]|nr:heavy metal translocating P-type ATPase [Xanthobacteraceae bacterium]